MEPVADVVGNHAGFLLDDLGGTSMRSTVLDAGLVASTQSGLPPFRLYRPRNLAETVSVLTAEPTAHVFAGGSDFFAQVRRGVTPEALVSVRHLSELKTLTHDDGRLWLGAGMTHAEGQNDGTLRNVLPALADAWGSIATVRIRRTGTIGGNLMSRQYRYEMPLLTGALQARLEFPDDHTRPVDWLWEDAAGQQERLLLGVSVDTSNLLYFGYERSMRPVITVALALREYPAGITATAVVGSEYHPGFQLQVETSDHAVEHLNATNLATALAEQLPPEAADYSGDHPYRRHLVKVLSTRLLKEAQRQDTQRGEIQRELLKERN